MKYNININQLVLSESELDITDAAILDYVYFICTSKNEKIESRRIKDETGEWTWVNYTELLKSMPLLRIKSSGSLSPRIRKIESAGFISSKRIGNQKLFIKLNSLIDELFIKTNRAVHETKQSYSARRTNNSIKDNNNNTKLAKANGEAVYGNPDINNLLEHFKKEFELGILDGSQKENRQYANLMIKKCGGLEVAKKVISVATRDDFYGDQIASVKKLYYKMAEIVQKAKGKKTNSLKLR